MSALCSTLEVPPLTGSQALDELTPAVVTSLRRNGVALVTGFDQGLREGETIDSRLVEIGSRLGTIVAQSPRGEMIEDVRDVSDLEERDDRGYRSGGELVPHSDPPTLIALYSVVRAKEGGESYLVKVSDIHDAVRAEDPSLLAELYRGFPMWRVEGQGGRPAGPDHPPLPVFCEREGVVSCVIYRPFIEKAAESLGQPLSPQQVAALDAFDRYSQDERLVTRLMLNPGDLIVLHNRAVLHARTNYSDWPELERRRHLKRLWIDAPELVATDPAHQLGDLFATAGAEHR